MDEGIIGSKPIAKTEGNPSSIEFPALTEKDLVEIIDLYKKLNNAFGEGGIHGFKDYTGTGTDIDSGDVYYNSEITSHQLLSAIAITRNPVLKKLIESGFKAEDFDAKILVENQIMAGMKILDLGCGPTPGFARCCRAMGADVWTVDKNLILADTILYTRHKNLLNQEQKEFEAERHIKLNLANSKESSNFIRKISLGDFNLVTEANLIDEYQYWGGEVIAGYLLKKGGVWCYISNPLRETPLLRLKEVIQRIHGHQYDFEN